MADKKSVILVVDDQALQLKLLLSFFEHSGHDVLQADSGQQAVELLTTAHVDLILLDILMPGLDGLETCKQIKSNEKTAGIPIIFMTALDHLEDKVAGFKAGGVDYITKPFQNIEVLARVNTHLELQRQRCELEDALLEIKQLTGILPICCKCKKVRDDKGYWQQVDQYVASHTNVEFSHGYCQECYKDELGKIEGLKDSPGSSD